MAKKITPNYAAIARSLAQKILKDFGGQAGETQNKPDDLVNLPTLLKLKKKLDELSLSTFAVNKLLNEVERHNHVAPPKYKIFIKGEIAAGLNRAWTEVYNKAYSIFNEAVHAGVELPSIPAGTGSFGELQIWIKKSLCKITDGKTDETEQEEKMQPAAEMKQREAIRRNTIEECDKLFIGHREHFYSKAKAIWEKHDAWTKELERLNPPKKRKDGTMHYKSSKYPTFPFISPIWVCVGKPETKWNPIKHCNERITKFFIPTDRNDALLVYYAALLILHDGAAIKGEGLEIITENIWSEEWSKWAACFFDPNYIIDDRSAFIKAALRHVQSDLNSSPPAETEQETALVKESLLAPLKNPVTCVEVSGIIRKRSDNIAEALKRRQYLVIKAGRKNYCDAENAGILWPKWKRHWQNKQNQ